MKVYVVEKGVYEDREIVGVYDSLAAAKSAFPKIEDWSAGDCVWWWDKGSTLDVVTITEEKVRSAIRSTTQAANTP